MAKKKRTAKQRAATAKLLRFNRSRRTKVKSKRRPSKSMARRRRTRRRSRRRATISSGFRRTKSGLGSVFKRGTVGKVVMGIGAGTLAGIALNQFAPQFTGIGKPVAAFLAGGPIGGIASVLLDGGLGNLGGLLGGGGGGGQSV